MRRLALLALVACGSADAPPPRERPATDARPAPDARSPSMAELVEALRTSVKLTDEMDAFFQAAFSSDHLHFRVRQAGAPCPVRPIVAFDRDLLRLHVLETSSTNVVSTVSPLGQRAAELQVQTRYSARKQGWPVPTDLFAADFPTSKAERALPSLDWDRPLTPSQAYTELLRISDPAWWTWDAVIVNDGFHVGDGVYEIRGRVYLFSYVDRTVCAAAFDIDVGSHEHEDRLFERVLPLLRAVPMP